MTAWSANGGDDLFIFDSTELNANDTVSGGTNSGGTDVTGSALWRRDRDRKPDGAAVLGAGISGIEKLLIADSANGSHRCDGRAPRTSTITRLSPWLRASPNAGIHIDGSLMDSDDELTVDHSNTTTDVDIRVTGGADDDLIKMGRFLDSGDIIEGGAPMKATRLEIDSGVTKRGCGQASVDADFTNVTGHRDPPDRRYGAWSSAKQEIVSRARGLSKAPVALNPLSILTGVHGAPVELDTLGLPRGRSP